MIKTTIKNLLNAKPVLIKISDKPLSVGLSFGLAKLIRAINSELVIYEGERIKICEKYGTLDKETNSYNISDVEKFNKEYAELESQEIELNANPIIVTNDSELKLSAQEIIKLDNLIEVSI